MIISVIIPTYNRAAFLPKAIESVLAQTYTDWELIVVDDGSTDNTREVVSKYSDKRITYIYQENSERSAARNNGIAHAKGNYICFLDSDNYMLPNRLEKIVECIASENKTACYYTDIEYVNEQRGSKTLKMGKTYQFPMDVDLLIQDIIATPQICCAAEILRNHQFNPQLSIGEDMELLFRITNKYPLIYIPNQATVVEVEHEGRSVAFANKSKASEMELKTLKFMFSKSHPANYASRKMKNRRLSISYFNASRNYLLDGKWKGFAYLMKSIFKDLKSKQLRYKVNVAASFLMRKQEKLKMLLEQ
ncbi:MAG: glycosyltransferase [Salinivirgaceae bacterium]|nr:glycosyltransferase [Salinivirgaceae bacterium]